MRRQGTRVLCRSSVSLKMAPLRPITSHSSPTLTSGAECFGGTKAASDVGNKAEVRRKVQLEEFACNFS